MPGFMKPYGYGLVPTAGKLAFNSYTNWGNGQFTNAANNARYRSARARRSQEQTMTDLVKKRKVRRSFGFKAKLHQVNPAKHYAISGSTSLTQNVGVTMIPTEGITQGTTNASRIGDDIYLAALKIQGVWNTNVSEGGYVYRIIVGYTGEEYTNVGISNGFVAALTLDEVFLNGTASTIPVNGIINPKAVTVLYDEKFDLNSQITGVSDVESIATTVQLNKEFPYQQNQSVLGKERNLFIYVVGFKANAAALTNVGQFVWAVDLIYKD